MSELTAIRQIKPEYSSVSSKSSKSVCLPHSISQDLTICIVEYSPTRVPIEYFLHTTDLSDLKPVKFGRNGTVVRWIDVQGSYSEIIKPLLTKFHCHDPFTLQTIKGSLQASMGITLDGDLNEDGQELTTKFLFVSQIPIIHFTSSKLFQLEFKQVKFLLVVDNVSTTQDSITSGTLISFRNEVSHSTYSTIRDHIHSNFNYLRSRGVSTLFMQLVRATAEQSILIEAPLDYHVSELEKSKDESTSGKEALYMKRECERLRFSLDPIKDTLQYITSQNSKSVIFERNKPAWERILVLHKRLEDRVRVAEARLQTLVSNRDLKIQKSIDRSTKYMSMVLGLFSPLAFLTGIYGMNFVNPDGEPGIPELTWNEEEDLISGYGYFWVLAGLLVSGIVVFYMSLGLFPAPWKWVNFQRSEKDLLPSEESVRMNRKNSFLTQPITLDSEFQSSNQSLISKTTEIFHERME